jgi:hypothetical protein
MNKETKIKKLIIVVLTIFLLTVFLSGCTENNSTNDKVDLNKFIGTWSGNMKTSFLGFRGNNPPMNNTNILENNTDRNFTNFRQNGTIVNITKLEFTSESLYMTITTGNETQIIPRTYTVDGNQLVLSFQFNGEQPINRSSFNDTAGPPFDNRSDTFNGSVPSSNGGRPPFNSGQQPMTTTYTYSFNEEYSVLYLDGSPFTKN